MILKRDPGVGDNIYPIGKKWVNNADNTTFTLTSFVNNQGSLLAQWVKEGGGSTSVPISQITPGSGIVVVPDSSSNVNFPNGNGTATVGTDNTLTIDMASPFTGDFTFDGNITSSASNATPVNGASLNLIRSRGTTGTPVIVDSGDVLGNIHVSGYDGVAYQLAGVIQTIVPSAPGAGSMPGAMLFQVSDTGSTTPTTMMRINYNDSSASPDSNGGCQIFEPLVVNPPGTSFNPDSTHLCMLTVNAQSTGSPVAILIRNNIGSPVASSKTSLLFGSSNPDSSGNTLLYSELACVPVDSNGATLAINVFSAASLKQAAIFDVDLNLNLAGRLALNTVGTTIKMTTGANAKMGQATLVAGTATVATTAVQVDSFVFLSRAVKAGTAVGVPQLGTVTAGTSFVIDSLDSTGTLVAGDTSAINWWIIDSA
ncbi:MAG: hypothetical protein KGI54_09650 [Pseudomonadota bacterium]|nr:hypothetical protein [Pseudomonadota bacterium]